MGLLQRVKRGKMGAIEGIPYSKGQKVGHEDKDEMQTINGGVAYSTAC